MFGINQDMLVVVVVIAVLFGAKNLPQTGKSLGEGIREFKKATQALKDPEETVEKTEESKPVQ